MTPDDSRPNILLIVTDQQRADALGIAGNPVLSTPYMDQIGAEGSHFTRAYSACPVCVPARRTLMTGARPVSHGVVNNYDTRLDQPTMPGVLAANGYHTHLAGKLHLHPARKLHGFMSADWADSPAQWHLGRFRNDYTRFLIANGQTIPDAGYANGIGSNSWMARPWHLEERFHFTNWVTDCAMTFLERRDPTMPFFLKVSYFAPHQPFTPPAYYFEKYMDLQYPAPVVGDWARRFDGPRDWHEPAAWRISLRPDDYRRMCAGYFGSIEHIDHQIGRVMTHLPANTAVIFVSDHGEMLGDHHLARKRMPYEGSANIPFLVKLPKGFGVSQGRRITAPVELMDVMPTALDIAGVSVPDTVDGSSVLPLLRDAKAPWRDHLHGECAFVGSAPTGMHYVTDGREKLIYFTATGQQQFFDLADDPREMHDLIDDPGHAARVAHWRGILLSELRSRPEGFVRGDALQALGAEKLPFYLPGYMRPGDPGTLPKGLLDDR